MLQLFHKESVMVKAAQDSVHGKGTSALILQMLLIMLVSEVAASFVLVFLGGFIQGESLLKETLTDASQLTMLFMTLATVFGFLIASRYYYRRSFLSLGLKKDHAFLQYIVGLLIGFVMLGSVVGIAYLGGALKFDGFTNASLWMIGLYFFAFMIQGFSEELMMRGFFMNAYAARKGMARAIFVNSLLFAALHLMNDGITVLAFLNLILAGVAFSLMAAYFDNIIVCSAAHTMWNFAQGNLFGVLVSGIYLPSTLMEFKGVSSMNWLNGGLFGLEGGIAVTIIELACILILCLLYNRKNMKLKGN